MKGFKLVLGIGALVLILIAAPAVAADLKIGVINMQKITQQIAEGKKAQADLQAEFERLQEDLRAREKELEDIRSKLEKGAGVLNETARINLESDLRRKSRDLQDRREEYQVRIRNLEAARLQPIFNRILSIVQEKGKKENYHLIIDSRAGLIQWDESVDMTDQVVKEYDKKFPSK